MLLIQTTESYILPSNDQPFERMNRTAQIETSPPRVRLKTYHKGSTDPTTHDDTHYQTFKKPNK